MMKYNIDDRNQLWRKGDLLYYDLAESSAIIYLVGTDNKVSGRADKSDCGWYMVLSEKIITEWSNDISVWGGKVLGWWALGPNGKAFILG